MILDKKSYDELDANIAEWETAGKLQGGATKDVGKVLKELVRLVKMTDKMNLDEITAVLVYVIRNINSGQENVQELCEWLYGDYEDGCECNKRMPGPGETGLIKEDGSYVTYKELGLEE